MKTENESRLPFIPALMWKVQMQLFYLVRKLDMVPQSPQWLGYGFDDWDWIRGRGWEFFSSPQRSDRLWGLSSLLSMGTGCSFRGVNQPMRKADQSPTSNA